ncbi:MAG: hypothetical protein AAGA85_15180 [Bacteroidota bacterium]
MGQGPQNEFLEAKRLYRQGDYASARSAFTSLYQDPSFGKYATFFAALSSYQLDEKSNALSIWRQLLTSDPSWDQLAEVYYWMILTNYELEAYGEAIRLSQQSAENGQNAMATALAQQFLPAADLTILRAAYDRNPDFGPLGGILARKLTEEDPNDIETIRELISKFDLDPEEFARVPNDNVRKDEYDIAVLFPFLFDGLEDPQRTVNNRVVMELYQGMMLAEGDLTEEGQPVRLLPYDTKRSAETTRELFEEGQVQYADLIVGPLFPGPNYVVDSLSQVHQINMVNPVSNNANVIGDNPFSFLIKPSNETMARGLAHFAADQFGDRGALVYYTGTSQDTTFASVYRQTLEEREVEILQYGQVDIKGSKSLLDSLIEKEDIFIESLAQLDSMMNVPGKIIKSRKPKPNIPEERDYLLPTGRSLGDSSVYYETKYTILQNSIGHIAVISRDNSVINSFIGVVETRADTIGLLGYGNWMDMSAVDYDQLERLGVGLAISDYVDKSSEAYQALAGRIQASCQCVPTIYHFLGYESISFLGKMLHKHGKYFQNGWIADGQVPGKVFQGYDFGLYRDNQVVSIIGLNNLIPMPVSSEDDKQE